MINKNKCNNTEADEIKSFCVNCRGLNGRHFSDCPIPKNYEIHIEKKVSNFFENILNKLKNFII